MTCHYEDLSSAFDWLKQIYNRLNFCARFSDFIWRENQCCRFEMLAFSQVMEYIITLMRGL